MAENYKRLYEQMKLMVEKYQDEIVPGLNKVIDDLRTTGPWISVEDRLPEETYQVLTVDDTGWIEIDALGWEDWLSHRDVTHWMPLPEPPQEANN